MDRDSHNGWPNTFTWHLFCHLSSYADVYEMVGFLVSSAPAPHVGADRLYKWMEENMERWLGAVAPGWLTILSTDLLHAALVQVDWDHLAAALRESAP